MIVNADDITSSQYSTFLYSGWANSSSRRTMSAGQDPSGTNSFLDSFALQNYNGTVWYLALSHLNIGPMPTPVTMASYYTGSFVAGVSSISFHKDSSIGYMRIGCFHDNTELANQACSSAYIYI